MMLLLNEGCFRRHKVIIVLYQLALWKVADSFVISIPTPVNLSATTTYQEFSSPGYPSSYPPNLHMIYYIETSNSSYVIRLEFLVFSTEDSGYCAEDKIEIYDGEPSYSNYLGRHCGRKLPETVVSIGELISIRLRTDSSKYSTGFKARYIAGPESLLYYDDDGSTDDTAADNTVYIILGVITATVLLIVIVIAFAINIYKKVQANKSSEQPHPRPNRRLSAARVYPIGFHGDQYNSNNSNFFDPDCPPPIYSDAPPRPFSPPPSSPHPFSPPPSYTMFDTNTSH